MSEDLQLYDRYIDQQLAGADLEAFVKRLASDSEFKRSFEEHRMARTSAEAYFLDDAMGEWHKAIVAADKRQSKQLRIGIFLIVCLILLVAILVWMRKPDSAATTNKPNQMFAELYEPDPGLPTLMNENSSSTLMEGMVYYKLGQYEEAMQKWKDAPVSDTLTYFLGQSTMAVGKYQEAANYFEEIPEQSSYFLESNYYDLLTALALNQYDTIEEKLGLLQNRNYRVAELTKIREGL